ncbi:MAG: LysM peptidoglycan-binding domain-containing protein [Actinomycetes bacterium]
MSAFSLHQASRHQDSLPQVLPAEALSRQGGKAVLPRPAVAAPLRLTRRGRIVLIGIPLILLAALLLSLSGLFNSPAKASDSTGHLSLTPTVTVTVQSGQSLWAIAGTVAPDRDARDVIADIVQLNNLTAGTVAPGQQLFVPTY